MIETACLDKRFDIECLYRSLNILKGEYKDIIKEYTEKDIEAINSLDTDVAQYFELIPEYIFSVLDDPKIVKAFNDLNIIIKNNKKRENLITIFKNNTYKKFVEIIKKDEKNKDLILDILNSGIFEKLNKKDIILLHSSKLYKISLKTIKSIKHNNFYKFIFTIPIIKYHDNFEAAYYEFQKFYFSKIASMIEGYRDAVLHSYIHNLCDKISNSFRMKDYKNIYNYIGKLLSFVYRIIDKYDYPIDTNLFLYIIKKEIETNNGYVVNFNKKLNESELNLSENEFNKLKMELNGIRSYFKNDIIKLRDLNVKCIDIDKISKVMDKCLICDNINNIDYIIDYKFEKLCDYIFKCPHCGRIILLKSFDN